VGRWWLEQDDHPRADAVARFEAMAAALTADAVARATPEETR
jgi:hypothetical protein